MEHISDIEKLIQLVNEIGLGVASFVMLSLLIIFIIYYILREIKEVKKKLEEISEELIKMSGKIEEQKLIMLLKDGKQKNI